MISTVYWDPDPEIFSLPFFHLPILWYGAFFALGFWLAFRITVCILARYFHLLPKNKKIEAVELKRRAHHLVDRLTLYVVVGTILGARLGHFIFYEQPSHYLADPLEFFRFRNGGLASHGAVIGILVATRFFSFRIQNKYPDLTWERILDFLAAPAALAGACIRIGNFFNQEILGTPSDLPWAVVFGHAADGSLPLPRHPVQLYESIGYLIVFLILLYLSRRPSFLLKQGKLVGLFLILVFSFRFFIEFLKTEQSSLLSDFYLTMGQILSIPVILLGFFFLFRPNGTGINKNLGA